MIHRLLEPKLRELAGYYPVVAVSGPRQSGKTTLCRAVFPAHPYVTLEALDNREYARHDPRGFLAEYRGGAVVDEIQNVPELLGYLQEEVDARPEPGRFVLTGSQHFGLSQSIAQSLAGRCGILTLLPPNLEELRHFPSAPADLFTLLWQGAYPRIYDRDIPAHQWLRDYTATYIERDVRQIVNVSDLSLFTDFLKLCAGRTAQEINLSALGGDGGVSHATARSWLSVLETGYIVYRLPAWHANLRKQVIKAPKLHFLDSGLVCHLLGINHPDQLRHHPLRGAIFESWVAAEILKNHLHRGIVPDAFHYREARGLEIDLLLRSGRDLTAIEAKSSATPASDFFDNLRRFAERLKTAADTLDRIEALVVYGGDASRRRSAGRLLSWREVGSVIGSRTQ